MLPSGLSATPQHRNRAAAWAWAHEPDTLELLQLLLDDPLTELLGIGARLPRDGLQDDHLVELYGLACSLSTNFDCNHNDSMYALYVWLHHMLGGRRAGLRELTADRRSSARTQVGAACRRLVDK